MSNTKETVIVIAGTVCTQKLKLYLKDGTVKELPQGNPNVATILELITGPCSRGEEVEISTELLQEHRVQLKGFAEYEKKSRFVRFINVTRKALNTIQDLFKEKMDLTDRVIGKIPTLNQEGQADPVSREAMFDSVVKEVMAHAVPVIPEDLAEPKNSKDGDPVEGKSTTLVAVTPEGILPNAQALVKVINHNVETGANTTAIDNLINRLVKVAKERRHSAEDFVGFVQRSDLTVAEDGSILAYKMLNYNKTVDGVRYFTDCHSGNVIQRVGSLVRMNTDLVDPDRNKDCSNGLHVARRGYLGSFSGSACVLLRVLPEDAIAVPAYNRDKMRVCAYQILYELPQDDIKRVRKDQHVAELATLAALQAAKEGRFPDPVEIVEITGQMGSGLKITQLTSNKSTAEPTTRTGEEARADLQNAAQEPDAPVEKQVTGSIVSDAEVTAAKEAPETAQNDSMIPDAVRADVVISEGTVAPTVDPLKVAKSVKETKASKPTRAQEANALWVALNKNGTKENAQALQDYKRKVKVSWEVMGLDGNKVQTKLNKLLGSASSKK